MLNYRLIDFNLKEQLQEIYNRQEIKQPNNLMLELTNQWAQNNNSHKIEIINIKIHKFNQTKIKTF